MSRHCGDPQAAGCFHHLDAGPQVEVIGIGEGDRDPETLQVLAAEGLDRRLRAHRHECGRLHGAMSGVQDTAARRAVLGDRFETNVVGHSDSDSTSMASP